MCVLLTKNWYSPHCRRLEVRMEGGVGTLTMFGTRAIDNGDYTCEVVSALHGTQLSESSIMVNVTDGTYVSCTMNSVTGYTVEPLLKDIDH